MAGLDNIKHYNGEAESSVKAAEPTAPLSAKAVKSTGPYALPTPTSITGVDPALLENMQQMIAEREARKNSLSEAMRDATAWWSGGVAGPGAALAQRAKERDEEAATTFGMKRDLAANKIAQQQAQNMQRQLFGDTSTTTSNAAPAQTGQQMAGTAPSPTTTGVPQGGLLSLVKDDALRQSIAVQASRDQDGAFKSIQTYLAKNAENPQLIKEIEGAVARGWLDPKLVPAAVLTKIIGSGALVPHDTRTPQGTVQATPFSSASAMSPAAPVAKAPVPATTPAAPAGAPAAAPSAPAATPAAAPVNPTVTPAATEVKPALPHTQPIPKVGAPTEKPVAPVTPAAAPVVPAAAPLVSSNVQTGFAPGSKEDLDAKAEIAKQQININTEQQKPIAKAAGESAVSLVNSASRAKDNILQYDMAESILRQYPKAFGISQDGSVTAMLSQLIAPGVTVPIVGTLKAPGIEEARAQKLGPKALAARSTFETLSNRFATEYANQNLTGEGRGTLSNADMKMAGVAKGLSTSSPAATNLIFAVLNRENEQMVLERGNAWKAYKAEAARTGTTPDFNAFRETDAYVKAMDDKEARIRNRFPEFFTDQANKAESSGGNKTAKDFFKK
jgi:hypothetical protein